VTYEIDLFFPVVTPGSDAKTSSLGPCKVITQPLFVTVVEHNGEARAVALAELREFDRARTCYTTVFGKVSHPRRIDLPDRVCVETGTGHSMMLNGNLVARMTRTRRQGSPVGKVSW
jgi:hypothetical protein